MPIHSNLNLNDLLPKKRLDLNQCLKLGCQFSDEFAFGILTKRKISIKYSIISIALIAPLVTYLINDYFKDYTDYRFGVEIIVLNGLLTFIGLWLFSKKPNSSVSKEVK